MARAVIFDMDGVLVDTEPLYYKVNVEFLQQQGVTISPRDYDEFIGIAAPLMWRRVKDRFGLPQTLEWLIENEKRRFFACIEALPSLAPIAGIPELLKAIRALGIPVGLASSSAMRNIELVLEKSGLRALFHHLTSGEEVVKGKPEPDIFLLAARRLETLPEHCLVLEDSWNGLTGAKAAAMTCVGFRNPSSGNQNLSGADLLVESFSSEVREKILALLDGTLI